MVSFYLITVISHYLQKLYLWWIKVWSSQVLYHNVSFYTDPKIPSPLVVGGLRQCPVSCYTMCIKHQCLWHSWNSSRLLGNMQCLIEDRRTCCQPHFLATMVNSCTLIMKFMQMYHWSVQQQASVKTGPLCQGVRDNQRFGLKKLIQTAKCPVFISNYLQMCWQTPWNDKVTKPSSNWRNYDWEERRSQLFLL